MPLVAYTDSEGSDDEVPTVVPSPKPGKPSKVTDASTGPRKIKLDIPLAKQDPVEDERPAKKARLGTGLGGFNDLLPAPKQTVRKGLQFGVNLKTSSEAAFSRAPVDPTSYKDRQEDQQTSTTSSDAPKPHETVVKTLKPMRFKPLSVANNKKKPKKALPTQSVPKQTDLLTSAGVDPIPATKAKSSLFSLSSDSGDAATHDQNIPLNYEPLIVDAAQQQAPADQQHVDSPPNIDHHAPNPLAAIASDLNLSAADRRQLLGRNASLSAAVTVQQFDMDREYAKNEEMRAAGEVVEHRAVKTVAAGKHSLQQLVNAASSQREALEDAWAQGRRNKAEAGAAYGFGRS